MYTCAHCAVLACKNRQLEKAPQNCPMRTPELVETLKQEVLDPETQRFYAAAARTEHDGYCRWTRVRETLEFCKTMGYTRIGVAFCVGLQTEAAAFCNALREWGFEAVSGICCAGGLLKVDLGVDPCHVFDKQGQIGRAHV